MRATGLGLAVSGVPARRVDLRPRGARLFPGHIRARQRFGEKSKQHPAAETPATIEDIFRRTRTCSEADANCCHISWDDQ
jgi:hypothetical protein